MREAIAKLLYDREPACGWRNSFSADKSPRNYAIPWDEASPEQREDAYETADAILSLPQAPSPTFADGIETACAAFEQAISDGYPEPVGKSAKCPHGLYGFEECITCYDDALTARIAEIRAGAGEVRTYRDGIEAAAKVAEDDVPQSDEVRIAVGEAKAGVRIAAAIRGLE